MLRVVLVWWIVVAAGCLRSDSIVCANGDVCPAQRQCDLVHHQCILESQATACLPATGLIDGDRCQTDDFAGICDQAVCIAGCGDGVQQAEECDDGNLKSHDSCSSQCTLEAPVWSQWQGAWRPRVRHVAAYHRAARKLVVFGGTDQVTALADVWERDDAGRWTQRTIPGLTRRFGAAMAYDEQRGMLVLFGGTSDPLGRDELADTWLYDGTTWTQVPTQVTAPAGRYDAAMANVGGGEIVLFGGRTSTSPWLADTWTWNGSAWVQVTGGSSPPGRFGANLIWAPFTGSPRAILFGGYGDNGSTGGGYLVDHWEYTATGWQRPAVSAVPTPRRFASMAFVANASVTDRVVLFGGALNMVANAETWTFDGSTWTQQPSASPELSPRSTATMTAAPAPAGPAGTEALYLIGGSGVGPPLQEIWAYAPGASSYQWSEAPNPGRPGRQSQHAVAYDAVRDVMVTIGGFGSPAGATYVFDGATWQVGPSLPPDATTAPQSRIRASAVFDSVRERLVVFGGNQDTRYKTLVYEDGAWTEPALGVQPSARRYAPMAFDASTHQIVMFGGQTITGTLDTIGDTWVFDTQWTQRSFTGAQPAASERAGIAYDPVRQRVVLYDQDGATWTYADAAGWTLLFASATAGPGRRIAPGFAFSKDIGTVVLYGGTTDDTIKRDMWKLTGAGWEEIPLTGELPLPRQDVHLVENPSLRSLVLQGGRTTSDQNLDDTWRFQFTSSVPDEDCSTPDVDDDLDKRLDADDPDCQ